MTYWQHAVKETMTRDAVPALLLGSMGVAVTACWDGCIVAVVDAVLTVKSTYAASDELYKWLHSRERRKSPPLKPFGF